MTDPVSERRAHDSFLTCNHLIAEHSVNLKRMVELDSERQFESANNVGMLLVSPLFMDLSDTEKKEIAALLKRNTELERLMMSKNCEALDIGRDAEGDNS